jgi:ADP-heptose:LPS heptosyltransferase
MSNPPLGSGRAQNVRVVCRQQLGDLLLHEPAIRHLAQVSGAPVTVVAREGLGPLVDLMPHAQASKPNDCTTAFCFDTKAVSVWQALWPPAPRQRILVAPAKRFRFWHRLACSELRPFDKGDRFTALALFEAVGGNTADFAPPALNPPPADWSPPALPAVYGVLHPTSAWRKKAWQPAHWIAALTATPPPVPLVLTSGPADWEVALCREIEAGLRAAGITVDNRAGTTGLRQYIALLSGAHFLLCVDGSAGHIAAAFGRPTLTLFGPSNPVHWHWPTARHRRVSALDYSNERHPSADAVPPTAIATEFASLLAELS